MNSIRVFSLLMSILPVILTIENSYAPPLTEDDFNQIVKKGASIIKDSSCHTLKLLEKGKLGQNSNVMVWKGTFDNDTVAVKFVWDEMAMHDEIKIYQALGAIDNPQIEAKGIPRIYYYGFVLEKYHAIVMTLCDGTLKDRYYQQNKHFDNMSILLIFKRLIEILRFINSKNVVHNDIRPQNIFLRGKEVFLGDFDISTLDGEQNNYFTEFFASKNAFAGWERFPMDDLESLVYTIWFVSSMPNCVGEGEYLLYYFMKGMAEQRVMKKISYFKKDEAMYRAFEFAGKDMISERKIPNYDGIIERLNVAIAVDRSKTGQFQFEWLKDSSTSAAVISD